MKEDNFPEHYGIDWIYKQKQQKQEENNQLSQSDEKMRKCVNAYDLEK